MKNEIEINGLTIDISRVARTFDANDLPIWAGPVALTFIDTIDKNVTVITANFTGDDLVDFEGDCEASDPIYAFCEAHAVLCAGEILNALAPIKAPTFAGDLTRAA